MASIFDLFIFSDIEFVPLFLFWMNNRSVSLKERGEREGKKKGRRKEIRHKIVRIWISVY
jgi:hypothetical protein